MIRRIILSLGMLGFVAECAFAEEVAKIDSADGSVELQAAGRNDFTPVKVGMSLDAGDTIRIGQSSRAGIVFSSGELLRLASGTTLTFGNKKNTTPPSRELDLKDGKAHFFSREPSEFPEIHSPAVTTAVRGTEFTIEVDKTHTMVAVLNGDVECLNEFGKASAGEGETVATEKGRPPIKGVLVNPIDAVQWTLYYPKLFDVRSSSTTKGSTAVYEAQDLLSHGAVEEAKSKLTIGDQAADPALKSIRLAQLSVISTVQGRKEEALKSAAEAWTLNNSAEAATAYAYALQSSFRLEEAKDWFAKAANLAPQNPIPLIREAEIALGFGDIAEAERLIGAALNLSPDDTYGRTVSGFISLTKDEVNNAKNQFEAAVRYDTSAALPRLGLGLAAIRKGDVSAGRQQIEMAASLEPNVSLYRSYLGKAYFEEEREGLAVQEYGRAITLDPNDPTPFLYRAFSNLSANKPVAALQDIEQSINLNDNRAVFRSSLLLDQDLGVRSANLAQVFNELGFSQAARVEAIRSINRDYNNYSAHRLLSQSYNTIYLNDAAISEDKLATLLSPLSFNLFNQSSENASFNEYSALFDRDQDRVELRGDFDTRDDLIFPGALAAGKHGEVGYLLSLDDLYTDGSKNGNYSYRHRARSVFQYQPYYQDMLLIDGNVVYGHEINNLESPDDSRLEEYSLDLGYHHKFGPSSTILFESSLSREANSFFAHSIERDAALHLLSAEQHEALNDALLLNEFSHEKVRSSRNTFQWIYDSNILSLVSGTQLYFARTDRNEDSRILQDQQDLFTEDSPLQSSSLNGLNATDLYSYSTWHLLPWLDIQGGATYTNVELEEREITPFTDGTYTKTRWNPKAGVTIYAADDLTLRGAYFETLRKSSLEDTTSLEPTLVGGINQRFTDFSGDVGRALGGGVDYKLAGSTYLGVEGFKRHVVDRNRPALTDIVLDFDALSAESSTRLEDRTDLHSDQDILRAYTYQVINSRTSGALNYEWSTFERTDPRLAQRLEFHKISLDMRYFDPTGLYLFGESAWRYQDRMGSDFLEAGTNSFWLVNAGLGYRLPARHGNIQLRFNNIFNRSFKYDQSLGFEDFLRDDFGASLVFAVNY